MPIDLDRLRQVKLPVIEQITAERDAIFHALSVGYSPFAAGEHELDFVYERRLRVAPSLARNWCFRSLSTLALGIDF